jgi:SsrA-binding protein
VAEIKGELFLVNSVIGMYKGAALFTHEEKRARKLLMHKRESVKLLSKMNVKGYSLIPTKIFFNNRNIVKITLGLAKGKKLYDKRETIKKRDEKRRNDRGED